MSTTKLKGFHLPVDLIKFLQNFSKEVRFPESRIIEALVDHLKNLPAKEQEHLIADYLIRALKKP